MRLEQYGFHAVEMRLLLAEFRRGFHEEIARGIDRAIAEMKTPAHVRLGCRLRRSGLAIAECIALAAGVSFAAVGLPSPPSPPALLHATTLDVVPGDGQAVADGQDLGDHASTGVSDCEWGRSGAHAPSPRASAARSGSVAHVAGPMVGGVWGAFARGSRRRSTGMSRTSKPMASAKSYALAEIGTARLRPFSKFGAAAPLETGRWTGLCGRGAGASS